MRLQGHGLRIDLPGGWEGVIYRRGGEATLHAASFVLPANDADYAAKALSHMGDRGILLVVTEFDPELAGRGLYRHSQPASVARTDFSPTTMQKMIAGRTGVQRFFTTSGRAFCLFAVIADGTGMRRRVGRLNDAIATLHIVPRAA